MRVSAHTPFQQELLKHGLGITGMYKGYQILKGSTNAVMIVRDSTTILHDAHSIENAKREIDALTGD